MVVCGGGSLLEAYRRSRFTILDRMDHPDVHISWNDAMASVEEISLGK